jgi:hypothetical protein
MNGVKTAVLAGVFGVSGVGFLNAVASAGQTDSRPALPPARVRATHVMIRPVPGRSGVIRGVPSQGMNPNFL